MLAGAAAHLIFFHTAQLTSQQLHTNLASGSMTPVLQLLPHLWHMVQEDMDAPGPAQGALQENQGQWSAFLRCLSQLNDDAWAQALLPKLISQGSAQAVAGTCSQLRDLCFRGVRSLDLSSLQDSSDTSNLEAWVQTIPSHFKHVTTVDLAFCEEPSYHTAAYLLPALQE